MNGFYSFLPFVDPSFANSITGIGWTAWLGATIFEFGAILGVLEAWNRGETVNFGWGVKRAIGYPDDSEANSGGDAADSASSSEKETSKPRRKWIWFSTDPKYWRELGFLAAFVQFCAATIFWIAG